MNGDMPDIEKTTSDASPDLDESIVRPILLRRFAHDITPCDQTNDLLTALGMVHGSEDAQDLDHRESHQRLYQVLPLENVLDTYSQVMGVVMGTAMIEAAESAVDVDSVKFAEQNAEVILFSTRAILASLMDAGVLTWGPAAGVLSPSGFMVVADPEDLGDDGE